MRIDMPLFKILERPLLPIQQSWVDAAPFVIFFVVLGGSYLLLRRGGKRTQLARRGVQVLSAFLFIIFMHRCLCMVRGWVFALKMVGRNDIVAFDYLSMFVLLAGLTLAMGRIFCGWACPLGFFSELLGGLGALRLRLARGRRLLAGYLMLAGAGLVVFWLGYAVRPRTQYLSENVAAMWGVWLLVLLFFVLPFELRDTGFKKVRYVSLALWVFLAFVGLFVTTPWCTLFGNEVDYSSIVGLLGVFLASMVVSMAWCRYLCPAGAALGLISARFSSVRLRNDKECSHCGACRTKCPMGALEPGRIDDSSCIFCGRCIGTCGFAWKGDFDGKEQDDGK